MKTEIIKLLNEYAGIVLSKMGDRSVTEITGKECFKAKYDEICNVINEVEK